MFTDSGKFYKKQHLTIRVDCKDFSKKNGVPLPYPIPKTALFLIKTPALHDTANARCVRLIKKGIICIYFQEFIIYF